MFLLSAIDRCVMSLTHEEVVVGAGFDDPAIFEDEDPVKIEK